MLIHSFVSLVFDEKGQTVRKRNKYEKKTSGKRIWFGAFKLTFDRFEYVSDTNMPCYGTSFLAVAFCRSSSLYKHKNNSGYIY